MKFSWPTGAGGLMRKGSAVRSGTDPSPHRTRIRASRTMAPVVVVDEVVVLLLIVEVAGTRPFVPDVVGYRGVDVLPGTVPVAVVVVVAVAVAVLAFMEVAGVMKPG